MSTCAHKMPGGKRCRAKVQSGSRLCFFHDPNQMAAHKEASIKGGESRRLRVLSEDSPSVSVNSAEDVVALMGETISQVRTGKLDARIANAIGYLSGIALKAKEQGEIEERLAKLEQAVASLPGVNSK